MVKKEVPRVAVVLGGSSAEAEVSRVSGRSVKKALEASHAHVAEVELVPDVAEKLQSSGAQVVFPVLHGSPGEDGTFQGFLEILGLPYVGSAVRASVCAMDKVLAKRIFRERGLRVAKDMVVDAQKSLDVKLDRIIGELGNELVVKPAGQGSAIGVAFVSDRESLARALEEVFRLGGTALVEERIRGKEITVAILERDEAEALPVIEITTPAGSWYDYEHRYTPGLSEHLIPAALPEEQFRRTQEVARLAHEALGCRDLSRVDFVVPEKGEPVLLEVNTIPGMTPTSLFPDAARAAGVSFEELVDHLVTRAFGRHKG